MSKNHEKEVLKAYDNYLAYFLDNDMEGINSLVKFPITYIADGESKSLDAFPIKPKEMMESKQWDTTIETNTYTHGVNSKKDMYCLFRETPAHNQYTGGKPLPEWVPSDQ
jgi:hypothetical protein